MNSALRIAILYALFAGIAICVNISCQAIAIFLYQGPGAVPVSVLVGTAAGLPVKYVLEKRHVFGFRSDGLAHDGRTFVVYSFMGVLTTLLFWGIEFTFHALFGTDGMRYLGGAIGLVAGNVIKYQLDKRYVFVRRTAATA